MLYSVYEVNREEIYTVYLPEKEYVEGCKWMFNPIYFSYSIILKINETIRNGQLITDVCMGSFQDDILCFYYFHPDSSKCTTHMYEIITQEEDPAN